MNCRNKNRYYGCFCYNHFQLIIYYLRESELTFKLIIMIQSFSFEIIISSTVDSPPWRYWESILVFGVSVLGSQLNFSYIFFFSNCVCRCEYMVRNGLEKWKFLPKFMQSRILINFFQFLQPIWSDGEKSIEFLGSSKVNSPPFYPQRVSPNILKNHTSSRGLTASPNSNSDSEPGSLLDDNSADSSSSSDFEAETKVIVTNKKTNLLLV